MFFSELENWLIPFFTSQVLFLVLNARLLRKTRSPCSRGSRSSRNLGTPSSLFFSSVSYWTLKKDISQKNYFSLNSIFVYSINFHNLAAIEQFTEKNSKSQAQANCFSVEILVHWLGAYHFGLTDSHQDVMRLAKKIGLHWSYPTKCHLPTC